MAEQVKQDARNLWIPVTTAVALILGLLGIVFGAGMAYMDLLNGKEEAATIAVKLEGLDRAMSEVKGSLATLTGMQTQVSDLNARVESLQDRMNSMDTRLQAQDAWIQTTRSRLERQGFDPPPYRSGGPD